ncbi:U11/U12 small nuclear ribonucleoprotein 25 kDa protein isoform X1 [Solanum pennellii]|uniref:U11/U12 small nuclear ribonucleoprotein 25 kDa protein isoform X1 n=2 Tax=Solanum subgen. Lycopersicon TaxID=49274 RepID=A0ABM1FHJ1_SOLPN|nr:U11/U12 small nuclear ribonucleoprotein 25 kDa protein isoform X1 [Solanum pennellii]XP_015056941.1 U11/U12 small nuclear ribonucleoprotein 25 kDa protein isoform X1 [Solanum pennellii]XP_015056942.1 U11/U12 small nuclear ribonucleoprotein 25 kDa protein isoform X1 [Solanum pennellii]XP_015056943.1 U11/U12 small nuclear ribonucleoprotein 25 kDa protein isoform X1 [Solanum pennellii]XP_027768615.1 U11/U12 small nuclear ribonucleoprotein 25 kDa protein isoform X1 [Solanum pennellii]XP_0277686
MGHHETNSSSSRDRSPSQQRHRHRRKERDLDRELSYEKRERRSGRDVIEHRSPRPRHDYSFSGSDHQRMAHQRPSSNFSVDTERKNEVFDPTGSEKRKDRDVSMDKTKADEQDLEAKKEQMTLLEMSGDLTTEPKQLTAEGRKEETNVSLEYSSDMKKARLHSTLVALLNDPVLADIPKNPTLTDVDTLISLELGSAMRISVLKLDGSSFDVTVMNSATVKDLKQAVRKRIDDTEQSKMGHRHISWRHVWSNFCLLFHNEKLLDDTAKLQDYSIRNNAQVQFVPYVISRAFKRHSKRRKHRFFHGLSKKGRTTD